MKIFNLQDITFLNRASATPMQMNNEKSWTFDIYNLCIAV